jgi:uncharacterized membrane protein YfcA
MVAWLLKLSWKDASLDWSNIGRLFAGALIGLPLGYLFIVRYGDLAVGRVALGAVLLGFGVVGVAVDPARMRLPKWTGALFGFLSGFTGGAFVTGGPPVVIYLYGRAEDDPREMKPTIQFIFLAVCLLRLGAAATSGVLLEGRVLALSAVSLPLGVVMLWAGHRLSRYGSVRTFRFAVQSLIGAFGVGLILLNWPGTS